MESGSDRARRPASLEDILVRHGLIDASAPAVRGGRAERRRARERADEERRERERRAAPRPTPAVLPPIGRTHAPRFPASEPPCPASSTFSGPARHGTSPHAPARRSPVRNPAPTPVHADHRGAHDRAPHIAPPDDKPTPRGRGAKHSARRIVPPTETTTQASGTSSTRVLVAVVAALVFAVTAFQHVSKVRLDSAVRSVTALDPESGAIVDAAAQAGDENVLIVGTDPDGEQRVDTVLLAHVPAGGGDVVGLAIPADLEVNRPPCREWDAAAGGYSDATVPAQARASLVSAIDLGGPQCATRVVQQLTGMAVTRFVGLDLGAVGDLVDAADGVQVCVGRPVVDDLLGDVVPTAGVVTLSGQQARDLLRARSVAGDARDGRDVLERQQRVLAALLEKVLSREVLLDPGRTGELRPALGGALTTDAAGLDRVLATVSAMRNFAVDGVAFTAVPISGVGRQGNVLLADEADTLFAALREGTPLPEQPLLTAAGDATPDDVSVDVLNASDRQGLAADVGEELGELGFGIGEVGNAPMPTTQTLVRFSPDQAPAAELLAGTVPSATTVPDPGTSGVLQLVLGRAFDDVLRAPAPADAATGPTVSCN